MADYMNSKITIAFAIVFALLLGGCSSLRNGGAPPDIPFDYSNFRTLAEAYGIDKFVDAAKNTSSTAVKRNELITGRIAVIDANFYKWTADVRRDRRHGDTAVDLTLIGLGIAGTATKALRAKTNLAAAVVGIAAGKAIIDKNYYFEKTLPALFEAMDASRLIVLRKIREGMGEVLEEYSILQAKQDLDTYMEAGNFDSALAKVGEIATTAKANAQAAIAVLADVTPEDVDLRTKLRKTIQALPEAKLAAAQTVIRKLAPTEPDPKDIGEARTALMKLHRANRPPDKMKTLVDALKLAGINVQ